MRLQSTASAFFALLASLSSAADSAVLEIKSSETVERIEFESVGLAMKAIQHQPIGKDEIGMSPHDAFLYFCRVGHKNAVPAMIKALSEVERRLEKSPDLSCTWAHLWRALEAQTGKHYGFDQAAWQKWWDSEGKDLPDEYFDPKKHQKPEANQRLQGTPESAPSPSTEPEARRP